MQNIADLKSLPFFRRRAAATEAADAPYTDAPAADDTRLVTGGARAYRDERDIALNFKLSGAIIALALVILGEFGIILALWLRAPTVVLIDRTTDKIVRVDNVTHGMTPAAELVRDEIGSREKKSATETFLERMYRIDPNKEVRLRDVDAALKQMHPWSAAKLGELMDKRQIITQQLAESQQSIWKVTDYALDRRDPYLAIVHANQTLTRNPPNGRAQTITKQCVIKVKLRPDPDGRREENANTGMQILAYDFKVLPSAQAPQSALDGYNMSPTTDDDVRVDVPPAEALQTQSN